MTTLTRIDTRPLTNRVPLRPALRAMRAAEADMPAGLRSNVRAVTICMLIITLCTGFLVSGFAALGLRDIGGGIDVELAAMLGFFALIPATAFAAMIFAIVRHVMLARRRWRLAHFSAANGWRYDVWSPQVPSAGMHFRGLGARDASDVITTAQRVEFGRFTSTSGSGRSSSTVRTEYVNVRLANPLPHIILDARANDSLTGRSNLPIDPREEQRLELEGDFPRHFRVYCPREYEADALYLLTPDVMAVLIDHARAFDIEIVDDRLILTAAAGIVTTDPARWTALVAAVDALLSRIDAWERWRDDRYSAPRVALQRPAGVATAGRRLREKTPWGWIILGFAGLGFALWSWISEIVGWFTG